MNLGKGDGKVRDLIAKAEAQGFKLVRDKKAFKLYAPDGKSMITISSTPSDGNYYWELRRQLKRAGFKE